ncbi:MAG TPA: DUF5989 family protein [Isosphaeraceae bacterium]|nr:DUF5989 family protein [Isosphaeraceae bacterium]
MPEPIETKAEPVAAPAPPKPAASKTFDELAEMSQPGILAEFIDFLRYNKKWWLIPILLLIGLFGILIYLSQTAVIPFIYTL